MSKSIAPVGKCIFCGSTNPPLSKEHIVPYALDGNVVLPAASCQSCAKITGSLEGYCLGKLLGPFRSASGFRTRRKKKKPSSLPLAVTYPDETKATIDIPVADYPPMLGLPVFPAARALRGLPPDKLGDTIEGGGFWMWADKPRMDAFAAKYGVKSVEGGLIDPREFARMIAKIGHSAAVLEYGPDGFEPLATDMILGRADHTNYLVGCGKTDDSQPSADLHVGSGRVHNEHGIIVQLVRLFARYNAPTYHVVVGVLPGGRLAQVFH